MHNDCILRGIGGGILPRKLANWTTDNIPQIEMSEAAVHADAHTRAVERVGIVAAAVGRQ